MNLWTFITIVSVAGIVGGVVQTWLKTKQDLQSSEQLSGEQKQQITALEERIKVLETIVTDSKYDLKREFENLHKKEVA
jgi:Na+/glutamate symporter